MADLINALSDARMEAVKSSKLTAELEKQLQSKASFEWDRLKYCAAVEGEKNERVCPTCYDSDSKKSD